MLPVASLPPIVEGRQQLGPGAADLWCFFYDGVPLDRYETLMNDDERARLSRLRFENDRRMFVATRALVRTSLSEYADVAPEDWRFVHEDSGKPRALGEGLEFNLTNTEMLVACVVSRAHRVGVDAERIEDRGDLTHVARRCFSPGELEALFSAPHEAKAEHFFRYWTLKESYVKARGSGLSVPFHRLTFLFNGDAIDARFDKEIGDDPRRWRFAALRASDQHALALAVETCGAPLALRAARYVPLHGVVPFE